MSWIDHVTDSAVAVAERLGYEPRRHASASSCKCPACGAERRHTKSRDRRGAVGMPHNKPSAWHCWQCEASGDAIDFASHHIGGRRFRELTSERKDEVKAWFGFGDDRRVVYSPKPVSRPVERPVELENLESEYPPVQSVESLWEACRPVSADLDVAAYLDRRDVDFGALAIHDCARALPRGTPCPSWAGFGSRPWSESEHRLIVPLYDFTGAMRSVLARSIEVAPAKKSLGAQGHGRRGLVMAGPHGLGVLVTGAQRHWHRLEQLRVTIYEGEIDTLRAIARGVDGVLEDDYRPAAYRAVLGIFAGSFTRDVAARVPDGTTVVLATDADDDGDRYAAEIQERIGGRCSFERVRLEQDR